MHGEYRPTCEVDRAASGSPPYAWGIRVLAKIQLLFQRITPICMGNTLVLMTR